MKINWLSPLPPAGTAIALYTRQLLPHLAAHARVTLWTDQDEWDPALERHAVVRRFQPEHPPWRDFNRADATFYNIGNNPRFHETIWQVSRRHPGLVILHDSRLQHFFAGLYLNKWNDAEGYTTVMTDGYGDDGRRAAEAVWRAGVGPEEIAEKFPLTHLALENALGVMVHTRATFNELKKENRWAVAFAPLPYAAKSRPRRVGGDGAKARPTGPPYRLIVFGYIGRNRRLKALLDALAGLPERDQFRLDVYGHVWDREQICSHIHSLLLDKLVRLHGFVSETRLTRALGAADLALNLRYPTMGEASFTQLQIWEHALPSLVTRTGVYEDSPRGTVVFVRPEHEVSDIRRHLRAFLNDPSRFAAKGEKGRRSLEKFHTPEGYCLALMDLAETVGGLQSSAAAGRLAERVGAESAECLPDFYEDQVYRRVAQEIHSTFCEHG